jgi:hypothetical protein
MLVPVAEPERMLASAFTAAFHLSWLSAYRCNARRCACVDRVRTACAFG